MSYRYYKGFKQQKWPSNSLKVIGNHAIWYAIHDFLFVFHCNYVSILHRFWDIIAYFPKFKDVTWPWLRLCKGQFVIPMLNHYMANKCTKFEVSSFSHSEDILGGTKNYNGSRDHNHSSFMDGLSSVGWD